MDWGSLCDILCTWCIVLSLLQGHQHCRHSRRSVLRRVFCNVQGAYACLCQQQMRTPNSTHPRISPSNQIAPRQVHSLHAGQTFSFQDRFYTVHSRTKRERRTKIHHHGREVRPSHHYTEWDASCTSHNPHLCIFCIPQNTDVCQHAC